MRTLSRNEWIAVAAAIVAVILIVLLPGYFRGNTAQVSDATDQAAPGETVATTTPMDNTKVQIEEIKVGTGAEAKVGSAVEVLYKGMFPDGTVFDASELHGNVPLPFTVGQGVVAGFSQGVTGMKVGGKRRVTIPPALGYGPNDYGPIPGNSTLIFEMELVSAK